MKEVVIVETGGTINLAEVDGAMEPVVRNRELISRSLHKTMRVDFIEQCIKKNSLISSVFSLKKKILSYKKGKNFVITVGTDFLEEISFLLHLILPQDIAAVITGAMIPPGMPGFDGEKNVLDATMLAASGKARGVLVVMGGLIHHPKYVRKVDSQLLSSFQSFPGAVGAIRNNDVVEYMVVADEGCQEFARLDECREYVVPILVPSFCPSLEHVHFDKIDGIILAGAGTGSLTDAQLKFLQENAPDDLPIVVTTRCLSGMNHDDHHYKGSVEKYESSGVILDGYEDLTPVQAQIKLMLSLELKSR